MATPRRALLPLLALTLLLAPAGGAALVPAPETPRILRLDLDAADPFAPHAPVPAMAEGIGPGSHLLVEMLGATYGCTANFVWTAEGRLYLGSAGHCFLPSGRKATHGPGADWDASDVKVKVCVSGCAFGGETGFLLAGRLEALGPVAYARQSHQGIAVGNDFGVVEIPERLWPHVRPGMPVFGGPSATEASPVGKLLCHHGAGLVLGETFLTQGRVGVGIDHAPDRGAWYAAMAATQGDSGSAVQACVAEREGFRGAGAVGILTHVAGATIAGTTVPKAIALAQQAGLALELVHEGG